MLIAITGTPGTGKSSACGVLERRGYLVVDLDQVARKEGLVVGRDQSRESDEIDVDALRELLNVPAKVAILKAHYSHLMDVNVTVVLRCRPSVLQKRLEARGWSPEKVRENLETEAIDLITQEAVARVPFVYEVDTTDLAPAQTANAILEILKGNTRGHEAGSVDWTHEVLSWY
jgi:adenylate kinase